MNENSRTSNVIQNSAVGILTQISGIALNFIVRMVFVRYLSEEYLGVNGLFSNVLTILSLAELGVGGAIGYSLYKPVAERNFPEIAALMHLYRSAYTIIGLVIGGLGLLMIPLIPILIREKTSIPDITVIYLFCLLNTVVSYFSAYKRSLFIADQQERILSKYKLFFSVLKAIGQGLILVLTKNFLAYLTIQLLCTVGENLYISYRADRTYPFLSEFKHVKLAADKFRDIVRNVKALTIYRIGSTVLDGTDNIILSAFVGLAWVGKLSNYTLIVGSVSMILSQIMSALTASVGNYIAKESAEHHESLLQKITFLSFCLYGSCSICLICLSSPFVQLIFGPNYVLNENAVIVLVLNFYIFGMMNAIWTFRSTMGLFVHGKFRPLVSAVINVLVSVFLVIRIGPTGVLLGTTITRLATNVWYDPLIVYKHGLKKAPYSYYLLWLKYLSITAAALLIAQALTSHLLSYALSPVTWILSGMICVITFFAVISVFLFRTDEFKYLLVQMRALMTAYIRK